MPILIIHDEYESLQDYMENGYMHLYLGDDMFLNNNDIEEMKKNNYEGICTFTIDYDPFHRKRYVFACIKGDDEKTGVFLKPVIIPDLEFVDYFHPSDEPPIEQEHCNYWTFEPYVEHKPSKTNMIGFDGEIQKIGNNSFVTENGINYQIDENLIPASMLEVETAKELNIYDKMEKDNFMGKIKRFVVYNTGEKVVENYFIEAIADGMIILTTDNARNISNIPAFIRLYDVDYENNIMNVCIPYDVKYIPYSNLEPI